MPHRPVHRRRARALSFADLIAAGVIVAVALLVIAFVVIAAARR
jgi:hypothetical protein